MPYAVISFVNFENTYKHNGEKRQFRRGVFILTFIKNKAKRHIYDLLTALLLDFKVKKEKYIYDFEDFFSNFYSNIFINYCLHPSLYWHVWVQTVGKVILCGFYLASRCYILNDIGCNYFCERTFIQLPLWPNSTSCSCKSWKWQMED